MIKPPSEIKDYCVVCNEVARRIDLSARAKGVYYYLATLPPNWKLSTQELIQHFTEGRDSLRTSFTELVDCGYITKTIKQVKGKLNGWDYQVHWTAVRLDYRTPEKPPVGESNTIKHLEEVNTKDSNKKNKQKKDYFVEQVILGLKESSPALRAIIEEHSEIKNKKKASKSDKAAKRYAKKLNEYSGGLITRMEEIVTKSCDSGWADIFELGSVGIKKKDSFREVDQEVLKAWGSGNG